MVVQNHNKIWHKPKDRTVVGPTQKKTRSPRDFRPSAWAVALQQPTVGTRPRSGVGAEPPRDLVSTILEDDKKKMTYEIKHVVFLSRVAFVAPPYGGDVGLEREQTTTWGPLIYMTN